MSKNAKEQVITVQNKVTPKELEDILKTNIKEILKDPSRSGTLPPIHIAGSPGCGKSTIVRKVAEGLGIDFIDFRLSTHESVDLRGLPVPNHEEHTVDWYVTSELPRDPNTKGILLFDEIDSCSADLQVAAYEIILDRRLGKLYKVPDGVYIVSAGNLTTDKAVAKPMTSALANRFLHLELDASAEDWVIWAQHNDINPSVIGFINYRPEYLFHMEGEVLSRGWPSPRSWERVSRTLDVYNHLGSESPIVRKLIYGLIGNRAGVEFMEFHKINSQFDNVLDYMLNPNKEIVIPDRADARYALVSTMNYLLWRGKDKADQDRRIDGFFRIAMELPADFSAMAMMSAMAGNSKEASGECVNVLFNHPRYGDWSKKYGTALRKRMTI